MILEKCTQTVVGKHEDVLTAETRFDELEAKMGNVPTKRRDWAGYGSLPFGTMVWERENGRVWPLWRYTRQKQRPTRSGRSCTKTFTRSLRIFIWSCVLLSRIQTP